MKRTGQDIIINVYWSPCQGPVPVVRDKSNLTFLDRFFETYANIRFNESPSKGSRVVPCARTEEQRDMAKLIVAFHNSANAPKSYTQRLCVLYLSQNKQRFLPYIK